MSSQAPTVKPGTTRRSRTSSPWIGRMVSAIPVLMMALSAVMKLIRQPQAAEAFVNQFGYPVSYLVPIGVLELACAVVYLIPRTAVLGAVLVTTYFGGAVATQVRIGDPSFVGPIVLGVLAWAGLYLREPRLRELLPLRQLPARSPSAS
jgi:hypothetical protein